MAQSRGEQAHSAPTHDELLASTTGAWVAVVRWQPLRAAHEPTYRGTLVCVHASGLRAGAVSDGLAAVPRRSRLASPVPEVTPVRV